MTEEEMLGFELTFGEHKGKEVGDVPCDYLVWLVKNNAAAGTLQTILDHFEEELEESTAYFTPPTLRTLLK